MALFVAEWRKALKLPWVYLPALAFFLLSLVLLSVDIVRGPRVNRWSPRWVQERYESDYDKFRSHPNIDDVEDFVCHYRELEAQFYAYGGSAFEERPGEMNSAQEFHYLNVQFYDALDFYYASSSLLDQARELSDQDQALKGVRDRNSSDQDIENPVQNCGFYDSYAYEALLTDRRIGPLILLLSLVLSLDISARERRSGMGEYLFVTISPRRVFRAKLAFLLSLIALLTLLVGSTYLLIYRYAYPWSEAPFRPLNSLRPYLFSALGHFKLLPTYFLLLASYALSTLGFVLFYWFLSLVTRSNLMSFLISVAAFILSLSASRPSPAILTTEDLAKPMLLFWQRELIQSDSVYYLRLSGQGIPAYFVALILCCLLNLFLMLLCAVSFQWSYRLEASGQRRRAGR